MYGVHIGIGKTSACVHCYINIVASWSHRWQCLYVRGMDIRKQTWSGRNPLYFLVGNIHVNIISGKICEYDFKKGLLLNPNSEKIIYRNLYHKNCDVFFEIPSQIVQITSHFVMRYRGNHSLSMIRTMQTNLPMTMVPVNGVIARVSQVSTGNLLWRL